MNGSVCFDCVYRRPRQDLGIEIGCVSFFIHPLKQMCAIQTPTKLKGIRTVSSSPSTGYHHVTDLTHTTPHRLLSTTHLSNEARHPPHLMIDHDSPALNTETSHFDPSFSLASSTPPTSVLFLLSTLLGYSISFRLATNTPARFPPVPSRIALPDHSRSSCGIPPSIRPLYIPNVILYCPPFETATRFFFIGEGVFCLIKMPASKSAAVESSLSWWTPFSTIHTMKRESLSQISDRGLPLYMLKVTVYGVLGLL